MSNNKLDIGYERLSRDDDLQGESNSISNQKLMLEEYAERNGLKNLRHFWDDGVTGTTFDRVGFQDMMREVEAGNVATIILKDMSRLGRDYLRVGLYMETMREHDVRLIAINDGVDTLKNDDDFTPFRNIMNEWYARDASRKIKSTFKSKGLSGVPVMCVAPYGYAKSAEDPNKWIVDNEAAEVVKRIYKLTLEGNGPYQICNILKDNKVEIPGYYLQQRGLGTRKNYVFKDPHKWASSTVVGILERQEYLGHTVNFKTTKHFKDKKSKYLPKDQWVVFENTHEAIIDQTTFDNVQRVRKGAKRYTDGWGYAHPLTGVMYCADCGGKMYIHRTSNGKDIPKYTCGNYSSYISAKNNKLTKSMRCSSAHRIDAGEVIKLISETLKDIVKYACTDKTAFTKSVQETLSTKQTDEIKSKRKRLITCTKRMEDLEILIQKTYEDNALGKLPDKRYIALSSGYENELNDLENEIGSLSLAVENYQSGKLKAKNFIELIKKYEDFEELTTFMLNEFVEKIVVHERDRKGCRDTSQKVEIYFTFIGEYTPPVEVINPKVLAEQEEEQRKKLATQERLHRNYLNRKANGTQQVVDLRANERRKLKTHLRETLTEAEYVQWEIADNEEREKQREAKKEANKKQRAIRQKEKQDDFNKRKKEGLLTALELEKYNQKKVRRNERNALKTEKTKKERIDKIEKSSDLLQAC